MYSLILESSLMLIFIHKILEKLQLSFHFEQVKEYFLHSVAPSHLKLLDDPAGPERNTPQPTEMTNVINSIVEQCSSQPEKVINILFLFLLFTFKQSSLLYSVFPEEKKN